MKVLHVVYKISVFTVEIRVRLSPDSLVTNNMYKKNVNGVYGSSVLTLRIIIICLVLQMFYIGLKLSVIWLISCTTTLEIVTSCIRPDTALFTRNA